MRPTQEEWESHKDTIHRIYISEGKTLKELDSIMRREHGFSATRSQYGTRFKHWGMPKNLKPVNWKAIGKMIQRNPTTNTVVVGGHKLSQAKVQRNIRRYSLMTAEDFMHPNIVHPMPQGVILRPPSPVIVPHLMSDNKGLLWIEFRQSALKGIWNIIGGSEFFTSASKNWVSEMSALVQNYDCQTSTQTRIPRSKALFIAATEDNGTVSAIWESITAAQFLSGTERLLYEIANSSNDPDVLRAVCFLLKHRSLAKALIEALVTSNHPVAKAIIEYLATACLHEGDDELFTILHDSMKDSGDFLIKDIWGCLAAEPGLSPVDVAIGHCNLALASSLVDAGHSCRQNWATTVSGIFTYRAAPHNPSCSIAHSDLDASNLLRWLVKLTPGDREVLALLGLRCARKGYRESASVILSSLSQATGVAENIDLFLLARACADDQLAMEAFDFVSSRMNLPNRVEHVQALLHQVCCKLIFIGESELCNKIFDWGYRVNNIHELSTFEVVDEDGEDYSPPALPLQVAAYHDDTHALALLLRHGADPNLYQRHPSVHPCLQDIQFGHTALQSALLTQSGDAALCLLRNGARLFGGELSMAIERKLPVVVVQELCQRAQVDDLNRCITRRPAVFSFLDSALGRALISDNEEIVNIVQSALSQANEFYDPIALCAAVATESADIVSRMFAVRGACYVSLEENASDDHHSIVSAWEGLALLIAAKWRLPVFEYLASHLLPVPCKTIHLPYMQESWINTDKLSPAQGLSRMWYDTFDDNKTNLPLGDLIATAIEMGVPMSYIHTLLDSGAWVTTTSICIAAERQNADLLQYFLGLQEIHHRHQGLNGKSNCCSFVVNLESGRTGNLVVPALSVLLRASKSCCLELFTSFSFMKEMAANPEDCTLWLAAYGQDFLLAEYLFNNMEGFNVNSILPADASIRSTYRVDTILEIVAKNGGLEFADFILDKGFDTSGEARCHFVNAVRLAQNGGHFAVAGLLKNRRGWTHSDEVMLSLISNEAAKFEQEDYGEYFRCVDMDLSHIDSSSPTMSSASDSPKPAPRPTPTNTAGNNSSRFDAFLSSLINDRHPTWDHTVDLTAAPVVDMDAGGTSATDTEATTNADPSGAVRTMAWEGCASTALVGEDPMLELDALHEDIQLAQEMSRMRMDALSRISTVEQLPMDELGSAIGDDSWEPMDLDFGEVDHYM